MGKTAIKRKPKAEEDVEPVQDTKGTKKKRARAEQNASLPQREADVCPILMNFANAIDAPMMALIDVCGPATMTTL